MMNLFNYAGMFENSFHDFPFQKMKKGSVDVEHKLLEPTSNRQIPT
jgi:hypothetical protein